MSRRQAWLLTAGCALLVLANLQQAARGLRAGWLGAYAAPRGSDEGPSALSRLVSGGLESADLGAGGDPREDDDARRL